MSSERAALVRGKGSRTTTESSFRTIDLITDIDAVGDGTGLAGLWNTLETLLGIVFLYTCFLGIFFFLLNVYIFFSKNPMFKGLWVVELTTRSLSTPAPPDARYRVA